MQENYILQASSFSSDGLFQCCEVDDETVGRSTNFNDFISKCLVKDPEMRLSATDLLSVSRKIVQSRLIFITHLLAIFDFLCVVFHDNDEVRK